MSVAGIGTNYVKPSLDQDLGSGVPSTWYMALLTAMPTDANGTSLAEVSYTGYARQPITNNATNFPNSTIVAGVGQKALQLALTWPVVAGLGGSVTIVGIALYDASTGGSFGRTAQCNTPATFVNGNVPTAASGA